MAMPSLLNDRRKRVFYRLLANGVAQSVAAIAMALLMQRAFDQMIRAETPPKWLDIAYFGGGMLAVVVANGWLRWRGHVDAEYFGQSYIHAVRLQLFRHITRIGENGSRHLSRGALMLRFVGDMNALRNWVSLGLARLLVNGLAVFLTIVVLLFIEPVIAVAIAVACLLAAVFAGSLGPQIRLATVHSRRRRGRLAAMVSDRISQLGVIETFGREASEYKRLKKLSQKLFSSLVRRAHAIGLLRAYSEVSAAAASIFALLVGFALLRTSDATLGAVVSAMVVAGMLGTRLQDLGRVYEYWNTATVARHKIMQIMALPAPHRGRHRRNQKRLKAGPGRIVVRDIAYKDVVTNVSIMIEPGEKIAVIGNNGSGKSTFVGLVGGMLQPDQGEITIDEQGLSSCRWSDIRRTFAMVSPDLQLLRGTLRLNLTYGAALVTPERLAEVLMQCRLTDFVAGLSEGLDTRVIDRGALFSHGERARFVLARALLCEPKILLLDEAESNLDGETQHAIMDVIEAFQGTVIYITHNFHHAARASRVLQFVDGHLAADGAPTAVLEDFLKSDPPPPRHLKAIP
ncbi:MAG: ABC transporter ATP-binding protein [Rhodospirillaceae bacterium]|jgi:ABC-type multidrug transport system fused ATPase/permease subunit|nr:ABC transporter ATP-binding protein [Rhodospirillaceae bacterium]MBT4044778.1 ABC transporter ATP-binding protein [Rhodospirillaceae bacterium]MBT4688436.1 ABC transporter ATP-binding protein [Rhodospirillaceae bacterium]MBT5079739.1 ABC transporter ATP-binding protein [Rhodospirillaceae bacterium]MBT5526313.1 ABC transporter ATP-binding protein [Rhodospirillaceae bacterium]